MIIELIKDEGGCQFGRMHSGLFDCNIDVAVENAGTEYAEKCAEYFNNMPHELTERLSEYTLRYCEDFRQFFDPHTPEVPEGVGKSEIFKYISPHILIIQAPKSSDRIAFSVEFGCKWEPEHGMEWTINDGKVMYVGDFVGMSPWYNEAFYKKTGMNYVFHEHCID